MDIWSHAEKMLELARDAAALTIFIGFLFCFVFHLFWLLKRWLIGMNEKQNSTERRVWPYAVVHLFSKIQQIPHRWVKAFPLQVIAKLLSSYQWSLDFGSDCSAGNSPVTPTSSCVLSSWQINAVVYTAWDKIAAGVTARQYHQTTCRGSLCIIRVRTRRSHCGSMCHFHKPCCMT